MTVSVVIPNYNGAVLLPKTLPKVVAACVGMELIIVDDASTDGSVALIREKFPHLKLLCRPKNGGFSHTVNDGVREATGELIVLLNSDAYPVAGFLTPVIPAFSDPKLFAVGMVQRSIEPTGDVMRGRGLGWFERGLVVHAKGDVDKHTTFWVSGGAGVFRRSIWQQLGGMQPLYSPFYWEDIDLSYRARKAGYSLRFEPESVVVHEQSIGSIRTSYREQKITAISYRNQFMFIWVNISDPFLLAAHILWLPYHKVKALLRGDRSFFAGLFMALWQLPAVISTRRINKILWQQKDQALWVK